MDRLATDPAASSGKMAMEFSYHEGKLRYPALGSALSSVGYFEVLSNFLVVLTFLLVESKIHSALRGLDRVLKNCSDFVLAYKYALVDTIRIVFIDNNSFIIDTNLRIRSVETAEDEPPKI